MIWHQSNGTKEGGTALSIYRTWNEINQRINHLKPTWIKQQVQKSSRWFPRQFFLKHLHLIFVEEPNVNYFLGRNPLPKLNTPRDITLTHRFKPLSHKLIGWTQAKCGRVLPRFPKVSQRRWINSAEFSSVFVFQICRLDKLTFRFSQTWEAKTALLHVTIFRAFSACTDLIQHLRVIVTH